MFIGAIMLIFTFIGYNYTNTFLIDNKTGSENTSSDKDLDGGACSESIQKIKTGNIELDSLINKIKKFCLFSPKTIPEIQKKIKVMHNTLTKIKMSKDSDDIDYGREYTIIESAYHSLLKQFSTLQLEIPDDNEAKKIYKTNSDKIKNIATTYLKNAKEIVREKTE
tara:strand:- start:7777 stop:8274 length:498 start_codon:yes stop_codon:yes gene_type:complete